MTQVDKVDRKKSCHHHFGGNIVGGLFLVFLGSIFLLNNMGVVSWDAWENLWQYWPVLIILSGINHVLGKSIISNFIVAIISISVFAALALASIPQLSYLQKYAPNLSFSIPSKFTSSQISTQTYNPSDFNKITLAYPANVIIKKGEKTSVQIKASENTIKEINTQVEGDHLIIQDKDMRINFATKKAEVIIITNQEIEEVVLAGAGSITLSDTIESESISLSITGAGNISSQINASRVSSVITGSGNITLSGFAQTQEISIVGSGNYNSKELESSLTKVEISGLGIASVFSKDSLDVSILGAGSVSYLGNPRITQRISGAGIVSKIDK